MTSFSPHLTTGAYSPLEELILRAAERYGDFDAGSLRGEIGPMFLGFANLIVDEVNMHPYMRAPLSPIDHYAHVADIRKIPDPIITSGLLAHYAIQQQSQKQQTYLPLYYRTLNAQLWHLLNGNTNIRARPVDGGAVRSQSPNTNPLNGLRE